MKEKLKNIKGITLIALVITIIVMIILVAVSVTVALNGGLFTTAKTASNKTELEKDKELLMAAAVGALGEDGKVVYANIQLPEGFEKESDGTYTKYGYTFIVDEYGGVTIGEGQTEGDEIDFEAIIAAVEANPQEYLARAQAAGQNVSSNTDIGIGTDGDIVNLDLWTYSVENNKITLSGGAYSSGYKGQIVDGHIQGTVPQYIYKNNEFVIVTTLGRYTFKDLSELTSIEIPDSITNIGTGAFRGCSSLTSIIIPNSVTSIGDEAFRECSLLESVMIPNGVISIKENTFKECSSLISITIPNSVTSIGNEAFLACSSLNTITIPNSVTSIAVNAFGICTSLTSIEIDNTENTISGSPWGATNATVTWLR